MTNTLKPKTTSLTLDWNDLDRLASGLNNTEYNLLHHNWGRTLTEAEQARQSEFLDELRTLRRRLERAKKQVRIAPLRTNGQAAQKGGV
jgi:hypothetical protein